MKNIQIITILIFTISINFKNAFGQATSGFSTAPGSNQPSGAADYIGWTSGTNAPLDIKNEDSQPLKFYTNSGAGTYNNLRMIVAAAGNVGINLTAPSNLLHVDAGKFQITNGGTTSTTATDGFLINQNGSNVELNQQENANMNFFTNGTQRATITSGGNVGVNLTTPQNLLHVDGSGNASFSQFSNTATGNGSATTGFQVGVDANGNAELKSNFSSATNGNMNFYTGGTQRAILMGATGSNPGFMGLGTTTPADKLHINDASTPYARFTVTGAPSNDYFKIGGDVSGNGLFKCNASGSYMGFYSSTAEVGRMWGNNDRWVFGASSGGSFTNSSTGPNSLVVLNSYGDNEVWQQWTTYFTSGSFTGTNADDGLKIGIKATNQAAEIRQNEDQRMNFFTRYKTDAAKGAMTIAGASNSFVGVGDFASGSTDPARRLEVFDNTASTPQVRISNNISGGGSNRWSDFETNSAGSLKINTSAGKIGLHMTSGHDPYYNLNVVGNSMYTDESLNATYYPVNNTSGSPTFYTLAVKTRDINTSADEACFAIYSNESTPQDRLAINADETGFVNFWIHGEDTEGPTTFRERGSMQQGTSNSLSYFGLSPQNSSVVMVPDYYEQAQGAGSNNAIAGQYNAKLWVESNDGNADNLSSYSCIEAHSNVDEADDNAQFHFSIKSYCEGTQAGEVSVNVGGYFNAENATENRGVWAETLEPNTINIAGYFSAGNAEEINWGVYAEVPVTTCDYGSSGISDCPSAAGFFNGGVYTTDNYYTSDVALKTNVDTLYGNDAASILNNLNVYTYEYDQQINSGLHLPGGTHYGIIAQEAQALLPSLVKTFINPAKTDNNGTVIHPDFTFKAVNYTELIPILIAGYQKQQERIDSLVQAMAQCCALRSAEPNGDEMKNSSAYGMTVELENSNAIILSQNDPNPFAENTTIIWNIPEEQLNGAALNAMLIFYDNNGTVIKTVKVTSAGEGSLLVYGNKLNSGIYTYSLVVNGKTVSTKRMVKTH